jgi:putative phosphoesterase
MDCKVEKVSGNCDPPGKHPQEIRTVLGSISILATHGDRYRVKSGLSELHRRAVIAKVDVVLYGHTHRAAVDEIDGILFVNPGSLQKGNGEKSFARLSIGSNGPIARIISLSEDSETP